MWLYSHLTTHVHVVPTTLRKAAKEWFNNLPRVSITSFRDLAYAFYNQFVASKKQKKNSAYLLSISQKKDENFREYIQRWKTQGGKLHWRCCIDRFHQGPQKEKEPGHGKIALPQPPPPPAPDFDATMSRAKDYMVAYEVLDSSEDEEQVPHPKQHKKAKGEAPSNKRLLGPKSLPPPPRCYTLLSCPRSKILSYIKEGRGGPGPSSYKPSSFINQAQNLSSSPFM